MRIYFSILLITYCIGASFAQNNNTEKGKVSKQSHLIFKNQTYDFNKLYLGEEASCIFEFKNISNSDVVITNIEAPCGCTSVEWTKDTITKKEKGKITVVFEADETGVFNKQIFVYIDKITNPIKLEIKGEVLLP